MFNYYVPIYSMDEEKKAMETRVVYNFKSFLKRVEGKSFKQHFLLGKGHLLVGPLSTLLL